MEPADTKVSGAFDDVLGDDASGNAACARLISPG
jgi:hypothetical protein